MLTRWKSLSYTKKFSIIACIITFALGILSMGLLGTALYYSVSFLFSSYPTLNDWNGDWVWPSMIGVGMIWSLGFIFAGITWHYLKKLISSKVIQLFLMHILKIYNINYLI